MKQPKQANTSESSIATGIFKPTLKINPSNRKSREIVIDFTAFRKGGIPIDELIAHLKRLAL